MITPIFRLNSREQWRPQPVETVERFGTIEGQPVQLSNLPAAGGRMNFPPDMRDPSNTRVAGYHRVVEMANLWWHQYWLWYLYNPWQILGVGQHEGDWEFVQIACVDESGDHPVLMTASQHRTGEKREFWRCELDAGRPVVYVALGSHANFFTPGIEARMSLTDEAECSPTSNGANSGVGRHGVGLGAIRLAPAGHRTLRVRSGSAGSYPTPSTLGPGEPGNQTLRFERLVAGAPTRAARPRSPSAGPEPAGPLAPAWPPPPAAPAVDPRPRRPRSARPRHSAGRLRRPPAPPMATTAGPGALLEPSAQPTPTTTPPPPSASSSYIAYPSGPRSAATACRCNSRARWAP